MRCLVLAPAAVLVACAHLPRQAPACSGTDPLGREHAAVAAGETARPDGVIDSVAVSSPVGGLAPIVTPVLAAQPGQLLSLAPIGADVRSLWMTGVVSDVRVEAVPTGVASYLAHQRRPRYQLVYELEPRPLVDQVRVEGPGADQPELRRMHWLAGTPYEPARLARMASAIELAYVRDGRLDARVEVRRARMPGIALCVVAVPGPRVMIGHLTFPGRRGVPEAVLLATMKGHGVNHPGETYDREAFDLDVVEMYAAYYDRGFATAHIGDPEVKRAGDHLDVAIPITEGPVFRLGTLRVDGHRPLPAGIATGDVFSRTRVLAAVTALDDRLGPGAEVSVDSKLDSAAHRIDLTFHVDWRPPWRALHFLSSL